VTTIAGGTRGFADGNSDAAQFDTPDGGAVGADRTLYVADFSNHRIRKIAPDGTVSTLAGSGESGYQDGPAAMVKISSPSGIAINATNILVFADSAMMDPHPGYIRLVTMDGTVKTLAGGSSAGNMDAKGTNAFFRTPISVAIDKDGNVYVADTNNYRIRKITPDGTVTTFAGVAGSTLSSGYTDGLAAQAKFNSPGAVAVDGVGNVYVADTGNDCIRKITPDGQVTTLAGSPTPGFADGKGKAAQFNYPNGVAVDAAGNVYVADTANHRIRKITPDGTVTTLAGSGQPGDVDGPAGEAQFRLPQALAGDSKGIVYVADTGNNAIRKITP